MMRQEIIMTTKPDIYYSHDILANNSQSHFSDLHFECKISSIEMVYQIHNIRMSASACIENIFYATERLLQNCKYQLFVGDYAWSDNNRITMHNKLWKSFFYQKGICIPSGYRYKEFYVERHNKVKFFSAINLDTHDAQLIVDFMLHSKINILVISPDNKYVAPYEILPTGWGNGVFYRSMPLEMLHCICKENIVCCSIVGEFDDRAAGIILFGSQNNIYSIKGALI